MQEVWIFRAYLLVRFKNKEFVEKQPQTCFSDKDNEVLFLKVFLVRFAFIVSGLLSVSVLSSHVLEARSPFTGFSVGVHAGASQPGVACSVNMPVTVKEMARAALPQQGVPGTTTIAGLPTALAGATTGPMAGLGTTLAGTLGVPDTTTILGVVDGMVAKWNFPTVHIAGEGRAVAPGAGMTVGGAYVFGDNSGFLLGAEADVGYAFHETKINLLFTHLTVNQGLYATTLGKVGWAWGPFAVFGLGGATVQRVAIAMNSQNIEAKWLVSPAFGGGLQGFVGESQKVSIGAKVLYTMQKEWDEGEKRGFPKDMLMLSQGGGLSATCSVSYHF